MFHGFGDRTSSGDLLVNLIVWFADSATANELTPLGSEPVIRYQGGTTTYLEVLDGQRSLFAAELTLAQARGNEYQSLVQLYKALGGGWR